MSSALPPLSRLGLGCVTFGREIDRPAAFALADHAVARGITRFDTAAAYGGGASETILGQWLSAAGPRSGLVVETKLLPPYSPAAIAAALDASLSRLRLDAVDTLYLHRWDDSALNPATLRTLDAAVRAGRVRALGVSNVSAPELARILTRQADLGLSPVRTLQNIHNFAVRGIDPAIRALCARHHLEIATYSPLGAGFLTGKHDAGVQAGSRFDLIPGHQSVYFNPDARRHLAILRDLSAETGVPMTTLALAWAQRQPQIDTVLVGGRTVAHLDQALAARTFADMPLLQELDRRAAAA